MNEKKNNRKEADEFNPRDAQKDGSDQELQDQLELANEEESKKNVQI